MAESEARAAADAQSAEAIDQILRLRVAERRAALAGLVESISIYRDGLLVQSQATADSTLAQYRVGKVTFASVLEANAGLINDQESFLLALAEAQRLAIADTEVTLGSVAGGAAGGMGSAAVPGAGTAGMGGGAASGAGAASGRTRLHLVVQDVTPGERMTPETPTPSSPPRRRFGTGALVAAALASAVLAVGGTLLAGQRGAHDHASSEIAAKDRYQCPMHPSVVQDHPGDCPICGMKLVKVAATSASTAAGKPAAEQKPQYQCPMHPSIVQDHPGDCPICGMKLVKVESGEPQGAKTERKLLYYRSPMDPKQTSPTPRKDEMGMEYLPVYSDEVGAEAGVEGLATVNIDPTRQQLIGLRTAEVKRGKVGGAWRTVGRVAIDETRVQARQPEDPRLRRAHLRRLRGEAGATRRAALLHLQPGAVRGPGRAPARAAHPEDARPGAGMSERRRRAGGGRAAEARALGRARAPRSRKLERDRASR